MKSYGKWLLLCGVVLAVGAGGFLLGRMTAPQDAEALLSWEQCDTIYATILEQQDTFLHVEGLSVNDINGQGEYIVPLDNDMKCVWRGTEIAVADLQVGDNIAITYSGDVLETYPAHFTQVLQIKKLS